MYVAVAVKVHEHVKVNHDDQEAARARWNSPVPSCGALQPPHTVAFDCRAMLLFEHKEPLPSDRRSEVLAEALGCAPDALLDGPRCHGRLEPIAVLRRHDTIE